MTSKRLYYSVRAGINPLPKYDLQVLLQLFFNLYIDYTKRGYFQQSFGYECVDQGIVPGNLGDDVESQIFLRIRKKNLYPIHKYYKQYTEDDLFDVIEFLYDYVSKPVEGYNHTYNNCGWHFNEFNIAEGQKEFRQNVSDILSDYSPGYELSDQGEILRKEKEGLQDLLELELASDDPENIDKKVQAAVRKYRNRHSNSDDKKDAIRDLADVLEYLRKEMIALEEKGLFSRSDEKDIFNLANNFGLRHHNNNQKINYDKEIWYPWFFYYFLSTIHAVVELRNKSNSSTEEVIF